MLPLSQILISKKILQIFKSVSHKFHHLHLLYVSEIYIVVKTSKFDNVMKHPKLQVTECPLFSVIQPPIFPLPPFHSAPQAFHTDESSVGSETQAHRVFQTAAGRQRTWLTVVKEVSQSGPGNNTDNKQISIKDKKWAGNLEAQVWVFSPIAML